MSVFEIDRDRLDVEWEKQSKIVYNYSMRLADARYELDKLRSQLDVVEAEIDQSIRARPGKYGLDKVTESGIKQIIILNPKRQKVQDQILEQKHEVDILQGAVNALEHKKSALERLVMLHGQNYFSTPVAKNDDARKAKEDITERRMSAGARKRGE